MALFVTFEGGEGSGKTLQSRRLHRRLMRLGMPAVLIHEPGGTPLGRRIARWLKWARKVCMPPVGELLMFNASRAQLVTDVIRPGLRKGTTVICDRYADSTVAYQGYGRGLDLEQVRAINAAATGGLVPDVTVLLDIPVEQGFGRKSGQGLDRFELEDAAFHQRVRRGYLEMAAAEPERWLVVDALLPKKTLEDIIWQRVSRMVEGDEAGSGRTLRA